MDEKIYKIGDYEFETLREYRQAQEDLKKIKYITDELDIYDPEVAIRLYTMMRTKKIRFKRENRSSGAFQILLRIVRRT